ncbi:MAG: PrsW family intramembrane metalloprotease [Spirochaetales bacterium]|jgi:RsiW-degrading membrane proteinase PrsW (M82 family)|nr:PrsW family intramembrane metalloprotease [Spirochaetales bacterium]
MPLIAYALLFSGIASVSILLVLLRDIRVRGGSSALLLFSFAAGFCAAFPAWFLEKEILPMTKWITGIEGDALRAFCIAGLIEEGIKTLTLIALSWSKSFRRPSDGIRLALALGLGFAFSENIFFSLENPLTLLLRGITSVPLHALAPAITGWTLSQSRFAYKPLLPFGFTAALILHGAYDFFLLHGGPPRYISFAIPALLLFAVLHLFRRTRALENYARRKTRSGN